MTTSVMDFFLLKVELIFWCTIFSF